MGEFTMIDINLVLLLVIGMKDLIESYPDFWTNFLSSLFAGVIIAIIVYVFIDKRYGVWINKDAIVRQKRVKQLEEIRKSLMLLELLKIETESICSQFICEKEANCFKGILTRSDINLRNDGWEIVGKTVEITKLINSELLIPIIEFNSYIYNLRKKNELYYSLLIESAPHEHESEKCRVLFEKLVKIIEDGCEIVKSKGDELLPKIVIEIKRLRKDESQLKKIDF
jgi:hypothetical protein